MPRSLPHPAPGARGAALVTVDGRTYPLVSAAITARAEGGLARTVLAQEFRNPHSEPLEVMYTLPLPADGAVIGYTIRIGERVFHGLVEKREEASEDYRKAILEGRTASLIEEDRDDTFTQRLGSIPPGQSVSVEIEVLHPLGFLPAMDGDPPRWEYRFPTVVGVRYEGAPDRVPDAECLDVDRAGEGEIPTRVELELTVADGAPESLRPTSATHDIVCTAGDGATRIQLRHGARLDRDLVVRWAAASEGVGVRIVEGGGLPGDEGRYALLTLTPPAVPERAMRRDLTVLLDASGSMSGVPFDLARAVVSRLLESLEEGDRFEMIAFSNAPERLTRGLLDARRAEIEKMVRRLAALEPDGGTEMEKALAEALKPLRPDSQRQVILVTDGYIGFEAEVMGRILRELPEGARLHTVSIGSAPNRTLTRGAARAGRGIEVFAFDEPSAHETAGRLCRATVRPVLAEITIGGSAVTSWSPARPRDVFAGQPLVLALEMKSEGGTVEVGGCQPGTRERWIWRVEVPAKQAPSDAPVEPGGTSLPLGALYGREVIADLELEVAASGRQASILDHQIEVAGLRHRIASRMTSLVAIAEEPSVDPKLEHRHERLPVEVPAYVSPEMAGMKPALIRGAMGHFLTLAAQMPRAILRRPPEQDKAMKMMSIPILIRRRPPGPPRPTQPTPPEAFTTIAPWIEPVQIRVEDARVLEVTPERLVVEFAAPFEGFTLPDGEVNLWLDGAKWMVTRVVRADGSDAGPHAVGHMVRLVLAIDGHPEWLGAGRIDLRWLARRDRAGADKTVHQLILSLGLPAASSPPG